MGEYATIEIAKALKKKKPISELYAHRGTAYIAKEAPEDALMLPSFEEVSPEQARLRPRRRA